MLISEDHWSILVFSPDRHLIIFLLIISTYPWIPAQDSFVPMGAELSYPRGSLCWLLKPLRLDQGLTCFSDFWLHSWETHTKMRRGKEYCGWTWTWEIICYIKVNKNQWSTYLKNLFLPSPEKKIPMLRLRRWKITPPWLLKHSMFAFKELGIWRNLNFLQMSTGLCINF